VLSLTPLSLTSPVITRTNIEHAHGPSAPRRTPIAKYTTHDHVAHLRGCCNIWLSVLKEHGRISSCGYGQVPPAPTTRTFKTNCEHLCSKPMKARLRPCFRICASRLHQESPYAAASRLGAARQKLANADAFSNALTIDQPNWLSEMDQRPVDQEGCNGLFACHAPLLGLRLRPSQAQTQLQHLRPCQGHTPRETIWCLSQPAWTRGITAHATTLGLDP